MFEVRKGKVKHFGISTENPYSFLMQSVRGPEEPPFSTPALSATTCLSTPTLKGSFIIIIIDKWSFAEYMNYCL